MNNIFSVLQQFQQFKNTIIQSGQNPEALLNQLIQSGKVNKEQVDQARDMANMFKNIMGGKIL